MNQDRILRKTRRVRRKIIGTKETPRLSVFRSNKYIYAQRDASGAWLSGAKEI